MLSFYRMLDTIPPCSIENFDWHSKRTFPFLQDILKYSDLVSYVLLSTFYLTSLIVYCHVLLLILILLVRLYICFKFMRSVNSLLAFLSSNASFCLFLLNASWIGSANSLSREISTYNCTSMTSFVSSFLLKIFSSVNDLLEGRIKVSGNAYYIRL